MSQTSDDATSARQLIPASETIGEQLMLECSACAAKVILLSRTIKTYCYRCGLPVTHLGYGKLYYEPNSGKQEQAHHEGA
jgi:predicted amidophosphoribosyltransferase